MGAQIYKAQQDKVLNYVKLGVEEGCQLITGGEKYTENGCDKGFFNETHHLVANSNADRVCQEEIFGPVVVVQKFKTVDEVIKLANDSDYAWAARIQQQHQYGFESSPQRTHRPYVGQHLQ